MLFSVLWWGQIDKVRTFLLKLIPKVLNWRELNPKIKMTKEILIKIMFY